jgi:NAD(P)-dependent dehydrogenase (short-subunit alcohol dehydrogenase family)
MTQQQSRVVLVSGATGGLGPAVVRMFAAEGARLVLTARSQDELQKLVADLALPADQTMLVTGDLTQPDAAGTVVHEALQRFGALDVVAHVTGGFSGGTSVAETSTDTWLQMLDINLTAAFLLARAALPAMLQRGQGRLIFVSSRNGSQPAANFSAYGVSKSGLDMLVRVLSEETRLRGINVNAVAPSLINTPANRSAMPNADYAAWVSPESVAGVIHFLASDAARDVHGAIVPIYGQV